MNELPPLIEESIEDQIEVQGVMLYALETRIERFETLLYNLVKASFDSNQSGLYDASKAILDAYKPEELVQSA